MGHPHDLRWSVKDVALHLLGVEIGNISRRRDQHRIGGTISNWDELVDYLNRGNQQWVEVSRMISSPLLIELLQFAGQRACAYFASLDPFEMGSAVSWAGPEPKPVWLDLAREYTERWHHQQHVRDAANRPGLKEPRYLRPVLATFVCALPHTYRSVGAPEGASLTLTICGDSGGQWTLLRAEGTWSLYQGTISNPDAEVILDQDAAWRLFTKGIEGDSAQRLITIQGNHSMAKPILDMVSIIA